MAKTHGSAGLLSTNFAPKIGIFRPLSVSKGVSLPSTAKERNIHDFWREFSLRGSAAATIFAPEVEIVCPCLSRKGVSLPSTAKERNIHDFWREFSLRGSFLAGLCILTVGRGSRAIREIAPTGLCAISERDAIVVTRANAVRPYGIGGTWGCWSRIAGDS